MIKAVDALHKAACRLAQAGIEEPRREARLLAAHLLGLADGQMVDRDAMLDAAAWDAMVARRAAREPLAFITGRQGFWTLDLEVSPDTLIPRPDSETLIEAALAAFPERDAVRCVLDLGTGTGCLLLAALSEFPTAFGIGVDLSPGAAALARRNAASNGLGARSAFVAGSWSDAIRQRFDLVLCNPPYIESAEVPRLMPEVAIHEPARALDGGADGLDAYRLLATRMADLLAPGALAIFEIGAGQQAQVAALARAAGASQVWSRTDLGGHARALCMQWSSRGLTADEKSFGSAAY